MTCEEVDLEGEKKRKKRMCSTQTFSFSYRRNSLLPCRLTLYLIMKGGWRWGEWKKQKRKGRGECVVILLQPSYISSYYYPKVWRFVLRNSTETLQVEDEVDLRREKVEKRKGRKNKKTFSFTYRSNGLVPMQVDILYLRRVMRVIMNPCGVI